MRRAVLTAIMLAAVPLAAQTAKPAAKSSAKAYTAPKTSWGDPDLQGQWPATANIPMQRPANLGERATLTEEELKQREAQAAKTAEGDSEEFVSSSDTVNINPPGYWVEHGKPNAQASLVVDPPNGRIPPLTPEGQAYAKSLRNGLGPGSEQRRDVPQHALQAHIERLGGGFHLAAHMEVARAGGELGYHD